MTADAGVEDLLRELAPRVLDMLVRRYEDFAVCEDAVQDALVAAASHASGITDTLTGMLRVPHRRIACSNWLPTGRFAFALATSQG